MKLAYQLVIGELRQSIKRSDQKRTLCFRALIQMKASKFCVRITVVMVQFVKVDGK